MKNQVSGSKKASAEKDQVDETAIVAVAFDENEPVAVEAKPKAAKKKAAKATEASIATDAVPEATKVTAAKSTKKAAKTTKATKTEEAPVEVAAAVEAAPKAAKKAAAKKTKGRELVTEEPGAAEVAEVLGSNSEDATPEAVVPQGPPPKLERLQKILAKAGISSRRKAEELILGGQVQINGKIVTELGTKADPDRDHVRVGGKLLQGPERIRYFVLNKPKGYVTTVSDPEGRPTVMQFFATERERLYPVGRLDYLSEGLLLVTNDGELANKLTKAASGVEKTYLVKVSGQPTEDMLDVLRGGVVIERGRPGENTGRVRTAPAKIRQVRQGDNPWYEVIIIEGRNRELRKMFEEIGHHVEKIRRVGYGPLVLDLEPGKLRELEPEEVQQLRLAADGKLKKKSKRSAAAGQLPTVAGKTVRYKKADGKPGFVPRTKPTPRPEFQTESKAEFKPEFRALPKSAFKPEFKREFKPAARSGAGSGARPEFKRDDKPGFKPAFRPGFKSEFKPAGKPGFKSDFKSSPRPAFGAKPRSSRPAEPPVQEYILPPRKSGPIEPDTDFGSRGPHQGAGFNPDYKPGFRTGSSPATGARSGAGAKPAFRTDRPGSRPAFRGDGARASKPFKSGPRAGGTAPLGRYNAADDDFVPKKTPGFRVEPVEDTPRTERPRSGGFGAKPFRPAGDRPSTPRSSSERPAGARPTSSNRPFRPRTDGPPSGGGKPFRPRAGAPAASGSSFRSERPASGSRPPRPGSDRAGTARPGSDRPRPFTPRGEGRADGPPVRRPKSFESSGDAPREFRPRESKSFGAPKKFAGKPFGAKKFDAVKPAPGGSNSIPKLRLGPDGQPRIKERHRNSFAGKNKGRPKPKSKPE
jgi:23S rRNA pseudouridine2605 synthase